MISALLIFTGMLMGTLGVTIGFALYQSNEEENRNKRKNNNRESIIPDSIRSNVVPPPPKPQHEINRELFEKHRKGHNNALNEVKCLFEKIFTLRAYNYSFGQWQEKELDFNEVFKNVENDNFSEEDYNKILYLIKDIATSANMLFGCTKHMRDYELANERLKKCLESSNELLIDMGGIVAKCYNYFCFLKEVKTKRPIVDSMQKYIKDSIYNLNEALKGLDRTTMALSNMENQSEQDLENIINDLRKIDSNIRIYSELKNIDDNLNRISIELEQVKVGI